MTSTTWFSALIGLSLGIGLLLSFSVVRRFARPTLAQRVAPSLHGYANTTATNATSSTTGSTLTQLIQPIVETLGERFSGLNMTNPELTRRLNHAGLRLSVSEYRSQQLLYALIGFSLGVTGCLLATAAGRLNPIGGILFVFAAALAGFIFRDWLLKTTMTRRRADIMAEFPTVAELMALSVAAGDTALGSLKRIATTAQGELAGEFNRVLADIHAGSSLSDALRACSDRIGLTPVDRFTTGLIIALERGTPLADVMRAQAHDARELTKRELMDAAGKKEIGMMVPVIFGLLPLTIIFAVFPGLALLSLGI